MDQLHSLRELVLTDEQQSFLTSAHFEILAALPHFERLSLGVQRQKEAMLTLDHLQALSHSRSWSVIEIKCPNRKGFERNRIVALSPSLSDEDVKQLQQLRVHYRSPSAVVKVCFQLQPTETGAGGEMKWTPTASAAP